MAIRCAHGDTVLYPLAQVHLEINGHHIDVEAALSDTLPMPVLLGTDVPQLQHFVEYALFGDNQQLVTEDALAVTTSRVSFRGGGGEHSPPPWLWLAPPWEFCSDSESIQVF